MCDGHCLRHRLLPLPSLLLPLLSLLLLLLLLLIVILTATAFVIAFLHRLSPPMAAQVGEFAGLGVKVKPQSLFLDANATGHTLGRSLGEETATGRMIGNSLDAL